MFVRAAGILLACFVSVSFVVPLDAARLSLTCADIPRQELGFGQSISEIENCSAPAAQPQGMGFPTFTPTRTATVKRLPMFTPTRAATPSGASTPTPPATRTAAGAHTPAGTSSVTGALRTATPQAARPRSTVAPTVSNALQQLVSDQIVTAVHAAPDGTLYYGVAQRAEFLAETLQGGYALWKKSPDSAPVPLTPWTMNVIGGVTVRGGVIYFNEGGTLRRMPDDNAVHEGEVVIRFPTVSKLYGHVNSALVQSVVNGQEALLISVGSSRDSAFPGAGTA